MYKNWSTGKFTGTQQLMIDGVYINIGKKYKSLNGKLPADNCFRVIANNQNKIHTAKNICNNLCARKGCHPF